MKWFKRKYKVVEVYITGDEKLDKNAKYHVPKEWLNKQPNEIMMHPDTWEYIQFLARSYGLKVQAEGSFSEPTLYIWEENAPKGQDLVVCKSGDYFETKLITDGRAQVEYVLV